MSKIKIVADSSCDFQKDIAAGHGFSLVPLTVTFGDKTYTDGVDIDTKRFYELLKSSSVLPKTSQPSPDAFMEEFRKHSDCDHIICVCVTSKSSGTYNSALVAKKMLSEEGFSPNIHIIDTLNASVAIGLFAKTACLMNSAGKTIEEILSRIEDMTRKVSIYFVLDTLEYVRRGGRIGNVKAIMGGLFNIKPILTFFKGIPTDVGKCRGLAQAKEKLIKKFLDTAANTKEVTIIHADYPEYAQELAGQLSNMISNIKIDIHEVGAVMGTYCGPGGIGLAFEEKEPRWA